ncbi:unnamed protein product [Paramecium pentaurelia]|uniref:Uncharacterized protein n=1 Tax=Paramecium pentaurelia TaxID=43138 RepID=A0A8S1U6L0_9CILI|nr:unnamed protein product [Paramecium pentaurelia]
MGCHYTKTQEIKQSRQIKPKFIIQKKEPNTLSQVTTDQIIEDLEDIKPPKLCYISNTNRGGGINKNHQIEREIGGKKEIFSQLYIRPYEKK